MTVASTTVSKTKQGYGYKYTDLAEIHSYLESIGMKYYQYIEPCGENDYIYTVPIKINKDGTETEMNARRGCRVIQATLSGKSNPAQENGSAITYARRYSLLMAFGLATEDDDAQSLTKYENKSKQITSDEQANKQMVDSVDKDLVPSGKGMTEERIKKLRAELKRTGNEESTILGFYKIKDIKDMKDEQYIACMNQLAKKDTKA